ncbi:AAA family ATPase [Paraburkholderia guartelaensis]|uniref:AAA family ATPase n=1 Tax=Paraburkholderia guartelaensis TaxID=2546446 RepID=A0ABU9SC35_9BURK
MDSLFLPHRNLTNMLAEVRSRMTAGSGLSTTLVVGPTGVGKTTLGNMQLRSLLSNYRVRIQENPAFIPAVMAEVDPADKGEINFVLLYNRLCAALLAPGSLGGFTADASDGQPMDAVKNARLLLENALKERKLKHLILDEAVHFTDSKTDPIEYGNLLKSLGKRGACNLLLLGAYGCERLVVATSQLSRRIGVVHYERYKATDNDFKEYAKFVRSLVENMPYRFDIELASRIEYLFEGTVGLPGSTADVLKDAAKRSYEDGNKWSEEHLLKAMPSRAAHKKILTDTVRGEATVQPYLQMAKEHEYVTEEDISLVVNMEASKQTAGEFA